MGMFLFSFCFGAACGAFTFAVATDITISCNLDRQFGSLQPTIKSNRHAPRSLSYVPFCQFGNFLKALGSLVVQIGIFLAIFSQPFFTFHVNWHFQNIACCHYLKASNVGLCVFYIELRSGYFGIVCLATVLATFSKNWAII
jgi:hypothetical protein